MSRTKGLKEATFLPAYSLLPDVPGGNENELLDGLWRKNKKVTREI